MLKIEDWLVLRDSNSQDLNLSEIARKTCHDRKTVRKYLRLKTVSEPQKAQKEKANPIHTRIT